MDRLVREGIDLGSRSNKGETALELAVKKNLPEMVRHLVKRGAKYCGLDSDGRSVIHFCVMFDRAEILEWFLEKPEFCSNCEQCNLPDVHGMGPVDYARDNEKLLGLLKSHGAKEKLIMDETERSARQVQVKNLLQKEKDKKFNNIDFGPDGGNKTRTDLHHTDFSVHQMIGKGSFGEVYLVEYKETRDLYAMKVFSKKNVQAQNLMRFLNVEKKIMTYFNHPFLVKLFCAFQTPKKLYLIMEYCPYRDVGYLLRRRKTLTEFEAKIIIAEVILSVETLHDKNIIHRDLKPDNILIDIDGHVKVTDFGLAKENIDKNLTKTFCGSIAYLPPEVIKRSGHNKTVDWYLLG